VYSINRHRFLYELSDEWVFSNGEHEPLYTTTISYYNVSCKVAPYASWQRVCIVYKSRVLISNLYVLHLCRLYSA